VAETDRARVQRLAGDQRRLSGSLSGLSFSGNFPSVQRFTAAVERVGDHRVADGAQVDADLVRAPGQRLHAHLSEALEPLLDEEP
jgi:hypothetical protein